MVAFYLFLLVSVPLLWFRFFATRLMFVQVDVVVVRSDVISRSFTLFVQPAQKINIVRLVGFK